MTWRVADSTGSILLSTFGEKAVAVREADILRLKDGYSACVGVCVCACRCVDL